MTSDNGSVIATMPVAPAYSAMGGSGGGFGGGYGWGNDIWLIIIILFALGGFGNFGNGGGMGNGGGVNTLYPWMNQSEITSTGFQNLATNNAISDLQSSVTSGFGNIQTSLCSGFAGVNASINGAQNAIAQQLYTNQISDLQQSFANQMATNQGFNGLQSQLASCCCENRLATANLSADLAREACADRAAVNDALRSVLEANNASTQRIIDQMTADKIDAKNEKIQDLERQLTAANLAASQIAQTSQIVDQTYSRFATCPVGTVPVYGEQPIFTCNNNGYGCGCSSNF